MEASAINTSFTSNASNSNQQSNVFATSNCHFHGKSTPSNISHLISVINGHNLPTASEVNNACCHDQFEADCNQQLDNTLIIEELPSVELLPLCDLLFNIISLAGYFCDIVFDSVTIYTLYLQRNVIWFGLSLVCILFSSIVGQMLSLIWFIQKKIKADGCFELTKPLNVVVLVTHFFQCGVLWRYFKLFVPVDLTVVKHEVRDLCMLRMIHAFCQAVPMLLIQVHLMFLKDSPDEITDLNIISTSLSMFNLCWAVASFSKNVRRKNMHKLVLTWLGVIFQFFWRLGTISSRVVAVSVFAMVYKEWIFLVISIHWLVMLIWHLAPWKFIENGRHKIFRKISYSAMVAWIYVFCYVNLKERKSRFKLTSFCMVIIAEDIFLMAICLSYMNDFWFREASMTIVLVGFTLGVGFMLLYYRFFHLRRLKHNFLPYNYDTNDCPEHGLRSQLPNAYYGLNGRNELSSYCKSQLTNMNLPANLMSGIPGVFNCRLNPALKRKKKKPTSFIPPPPSSLPVLTDASLFSPLNVAHITPTQPNITGSHGPISNNNERGAITATTTMSSHQSNCSVTKSPPQLSSPPVSGAVGGRLSVTSPLLYFGESVARNLSSPTQSILQNQLNIPNTRVTSPVTVATAVGINSICEAPPPAVVNQTMTGSSGNEGETGTNCSRVNIQQKLLEKKQQQLNQLREIEEEIKQGKLKPQAVYEPPMVGTAYPPPMAKKQPWLNDRTFHSKSKNRGLSYYYYYHPFHRKMRIRSHTPEVLLVPHYLEKSRVYYDLPPSGILPPSVYRRRMAAAAAEIAVADDESSLDEGQIDDFGRKEATKMKQIKNLKIGKAVVAGKELKVSNLTQRSPSSLESQISLPRSYTLPREFRFHRNGGHGKLRPALTRAAEGEVPINNSSSDGDVDSDFNTYDEGDGGPPDVSKLPLPTMSHAYRKRNRRVRE